MPERNAELHNEARFISSKEGIIDNRTPETIIFREPPIENKRIKKILSNLKEVPKPKKDNR